MQSQAAGFPPGQPTGYPPYPPPPASDSRLPWPPPPGSQQPASLPPAGQAPPPGGFPPAGPPQVYGAPVPADTQFDTQRMLQPQGLFQPPRPPEPWPASGPGSNPFAPPLPGGTNEGLSATLPRGMDPVQPGGPYPPGGQFQPGDPYPPGGQFPPGGPQRQRKLPGGPMAIGIVAAVIVLLVAAIALLNRHSGGSGTGTTAGGTTPTATASAATMSQQHQAAIQLAGLLPQSGTDRADVIDAVGNVRSCGKNLGKDAQVFTTAASNRRALLSKLASLPKRSALPAAMLTDLSGAWQASAKVDTDLAQWASTAASHGCHKGNPKDRSLQASYGPDGQATADKQAFARLWNPLAKRYDLRTYQWEQL
jgi:hypothetical protein